MFSTDGMHIDRFHARGGYAELRLLVCSRQVRRIDSSAWQWVKGHIGCWMPLTGFTCLWFNHCFFLVIPESTNCACSQSLIHYYTCLVFTFPFFIMLSALQNKLDYGSALSSKVKTCTSTCVITCCYWVADATKPQSASKNGKKSDSSSSSFFTWFIVLALLGVWTSVAVVYFDLVDYQGVLGE